MKKIVLAAAFLAASAGIAGAADLGKRVVKPVPYVAAPTFSWTGFYVGVHGGYAWGDSTIRALGVSGTSNGSGGFGGGQVGYNYQINQFVVGVEADVSAGSIGKTYNVVGGSFKTEADYFGTVRARAGYAFDRALVYATGGFAWGNNEVKVSAPGVSVSSSNTHTGWTIGGGLEYAIWGNWSAKAEYLYTDYGSKNYLVGIVPGGVKADLNTHSIKVGINYHF